MHFLFAGETQANQIMDKAIHKGQWEHYNYIYIQTVIIYAVPGALQGLNGTLQLESNEEGSPETL